MATLFTRIINGELPGRIVWADEHCVVLLTIEPVTSGHALVIPRIEVDHWLDADDALLARLLLVAKTVGAAQLAEFGGLRAGLLIQGYGVDHLHVHVWPTSSPADFEPSAARPGLPAELLDAEAERLRERLVDHGHGEHVVAAGARPTPPVEGGS